MGSISKTPKVPSAKVPVAIVLECKADGKMIPKFLKWKNGCIYKIDEVLDIKPKGANRFFYKVMINGKKTNLYYDNHIWLVDAKG